MNTDTLRLIKLFNGKGHVIKAHQCICRTFIYMKKSWYQKTRNIPSSRFSSVLLPILFFVLKELEHRILGRNKKMISPHIEWCKCIGKYPGLCTIFMPHHSKNGGGALSVTPVRACVRACVRPSVFKIWCPLNNFWKTASIQFKFGMLIYNIKTQVEFDLGYNH